MPLTDEELRERVAALCWYHSIDLGNGLKTAGVSQGPVVGEDELPDLAGKTVLDVGAWDGYYSFLAERLGAARVVALDHYAWGVDIPARDRYWEECRRNGTLPDPGRDLSEFWDPALPGKQGFDLAREALGSHVEPLVCNFTDDDLSSLGTFDVTFFFGVLYHLRDPLDGLARLRSVTKSIAVVETEAVHFQGYDNESYLQFRAGDELQRDFTNWFVPSIEGLRQLCRAAGFHHVRVVRAMPSIPMPPAAAPEPPSLMAGVKRAVLSRLGGGTVPASPDGVPGGVATSPTASPPSANFRAIVHAYV
jgi:tRNA (mo5U34)-methyltransferase